MAKRKKSSRDGAIRPMPGSAPVADAVQHPYLVTLKESEQAVSAASGRAAVVQAATARTADFRRKLLSFLHDSRLESQVRHIGEPMAFPMIGIVCTPEVARKLRALPEVDTVLQDDPTLETIHSG